MLRVAAETGIGEELCAEIGFFEAAPLTDTLDDPLPIEALGDFVVHFLKVTRSTAP
jgi:hypothetical protein